MGFAIATVSARLLASPILQEYDAFIVELAMNPDDSGNLANRTTLWKSQKRVGGKRNIQIGWPESCLSPTCGSGRPSQNA